MPDNTPCTDAVTVTTTAWPSGYTPPAKIKRDVKEKREEGKQLDQKRKAWY